MTTTCTPRPAPANVSRSPRTYTPAVDILETAEQFVLLADVPGATADRVDVKYDSGVLSIRAAVAPRHEGGRTLVREYGVGDFVREFRLGEGIDAQRIVAEVVNGVLRVELPKTERIRVRKIEVRGAEHGG